MWRHLILVLGLFSSLAHAIDSAVHVARLPRFRCEQALQKHVDHVDYQNAPSILSSIFDYSSPNKAMDVLPGVKPRALFALGLDPNEDLRDLRLATSWLRSGLRPHAELYVRSSRVDTRARQVLKMDLLTGSVMRWRAPGEVHHPGAIFPADVELGLLSAENRDQVQPYLSVRLVEGAGAVFAIGLDVDCNKIREYTSEPASSFRVLTEQGILCTIPVLLGEAVLHGREHVTQFN